MRNKKTRLYLAETVHIITLKGDIGLWYHINSPNHLPYNSVHRTITPTHLGANTHISQHFSRIGNGVLSTNKYLEIH